MPHSDVMSKEMKIESPNDWLVKAGAKPVDDGVILPIQCLLVPMTLASEAIVSYRAANSLNEWIKHGLVVVTMVRIADTAYFIRVAKMILDRQEAANNTSICQHCLRGQLWPTEIKKYRQQANKNIIHKMEEGLPINRTDLEVVELYYEEIFKHPLTNPISWDERPGLDMCQNCRKKNT